MEEVIEADGTNITCVVAYGLIEDQGLRYFAAFANGDEIVPIAFNSGEEEGIPTFANRDDLHEFLTDEGFVKLEVDVYQLPASFQIVKRSAQ